MGMRVPGLDVRVPGRQAACPARQPDTALWLLAGRPASPASQKQAGSWQFRVTIGLTDGGRPRGALREWAVGSGERLPCVLTPPCGAGRGRVVLSRVESDGLARCPRSCILAGGLTITLYLFVVQ